MKLFASYSRIPTCVYTRLRLPQRRLSILLSQPSNTPYQTTRYITILQSRVSTTTQTETQRQLQLQFQFRVS